MPGGRAVAGVVRRGVAALVLFGLGSGATAQPLPAPGWFDAGRPGTQALQALALLDDAAAEGLQPADYGAAELRRAFAAAGQGAVPEPAQEARLDAALTAAMQRYLGDLRRGRVDPRQLGAPHAPATDYDAAAHLREALAAQRLPQAVRDAAPRLPQYALLRQALAQYRALGDHSAWRQPLPALPGARAGGKLEPGQAWAGVPLLAERLRALGDLPPALPAVARAPVAASAPLARVAASAPSAPVATPAAPPGLPRYDATLAEGLRAFQRRHGLADDGVLGRATRAALEVSPAARAQQIALTMERLRWTPLLQAPRMIVVNLPEFVLRAYETRGAQVEVKLAMKVIVGRALDTRTPLLDEPMRLIEFSPYWNVPRSIARAETLPRLRRDPAYFAQQGFEFVTGEGRVVTSLSAAALDAVQRGEWRIRQRPGPANALGDIKFVFPNNEAIYLHHTPAVSLFERDRRDFSHGCIRVQDPVALARFVLRDEPDWTEDRIRAAMGARSASTIRLAQPLPVLITYGTALVKGGRPHFFADVYGHDRLLEQALRRRGAPVPPA